MILSEQTSLQPSEQTSPQPSPFEGEGEDQILLNEGGAEATLPLDKGEVGGGIDLSSANKIKYTYVPKSL
ncbi:MAG: hypothetical protein LBQ59_00910 [Candidatus Peribacteria bacterium]|nr:hypothetical protein [Candidatus Peribacteria bacterium]